RREVPSVFGFVSAWAHMAADGRAVGVRERSGELRGRSPGAEYPGPGRRMAGNSERTRGAGEETMAVATKATRHEPLRLAVEAKRHDAWWVEPLIVVVVLAG